MTNLGVNLLTILTFFYGIFWASALSTNAKYHPFDPLGFFSKKPEAYKIRRRFYVSFLTLDIIPVAYFALIFYLFSRFSPINELGWHNIFLTGFASLSVFGFTRIFPGIIASNKTYRFFYPNKDCSKYEITQDSHSFKAYLISGLIYLAIPFIALFIIYHAK